MARDVSQVYFAATVESIANSSGRSLAILAAETSTEVDSYRFDLALRRAGDNLSAVAIIGDDASYSSTATHLAAELGLALYVLADGSDVAKLAVDIYRAQQGDVADRTRVIESTAQILDRVNPTADDPDNLIRTVGEHLGIDLHLEVGHHKAAGLDVRDPTDERVTIVWANGFEPDGLQMLVLQRLGQKISEIRFERVRNSQLLDAARSELLGELLLADASVSQAVASRLRRDAMPIDGWHHVVRLEPTNLETARPSDDEAALYTVRQTLSTTALNCARIGGASWHQAATATTLTLVRSDRAGSRPAISQQLTGTVSKIIDAVTNHYPDLEFAVGIGSGHRGVSGLRASAAEAASALLASRADRRDNHPVHFDGLGVRRTLLQWYAIDDVRETVDELMAPLDRLATNKAELAIETLRAFLDNESSITRAAMALHVHRNTVQYRIDRLAALLDIDFEDAEQRLLLQLACRVRRGG